MEIYPIYHKQFQNNYQNAFKTLPKAQRTRGLSSYHRISIKHQLQNLNQINISILTKSKVKILTKLQLQNLDQTSVSSISCCQLSLELTKITQTRSMTTGQLFCNLSFNTTFLQNLQIVGTDNFVATSQNFVQGNIFANCSSRSYFCKICNLLFETFLLLLFVVHGNCFTNCCTRHLFATFTNYCLGSGRSACQSGQSCEVKWSLGSLVSLEYPRQASKYPNQRNIQISCNTYIITSDSFVVIFVPFGQF